ncbi:hypothetical protein L1D46_19170, partial [Pseudoalteromonas sp. Isolate3]
NGDTNLLNNKHFILSVYPQENGFFYQYTQNQTPTMNFYDYKQGVQNLSNDFQQFCVVFCSQITALNGNTILLKEQHDTADILVLKIALK